MKRTRARWLLALLLAHPGWVEAIDFTPLNGMKRLETVKIPILYFSDAGRTVVYQPPGAWKVAGRPDAFEMTPPAPAEASVRWTTIKLTAEQQAMLADAAQEEKWVAGFLPPGAENVVLEATNPSPFMLGPHQSSEWVFRFSVGGRGGGLSVARSDLAGGERFIQVIHADAKHFDAVRSEAISSLFSWSWR